MLEHLGKATRIALFFQKIALILCYQPLPTSQMIMFTPWFFIFDHLSIEILKKYYKSEKRIPKAIAIFVSIVLILCSAVFVSAYKETLTEFNWNWGLQVFSDWSNFGLFAERGLYNFFIVLLSIVPTTFIYYLIQKYIRQNQSKKEQSKFSLVMYQIVNKASFINKFQERLESLPSVITTNGKYAGLALLFLPGLFLVFHQPWMHLSATLPYELSKMLFISMMLGGNSFGHISGVNVNSLSGSSFYDYKKDPYYITNLNDEMDPFIKQALEKVTGTGGFTHVVHIVLESMRSDVFPYDTEGALHKFIKDETLMTVDASTITPFVSSLAKNMIQWDGLQTTISYTHKAMLAYFCGQLPLPIDFTREAMDGCQFYQTCWPQVLRHLNGIGENNDNELAFMNDENSKVQTQQWETAQIASFTGQWDHTHDIFTRAGFETTVDAENILKGLHRDKKFDEKWGYYDEDGFKVLWKYIDQLQKRQKKNKMMISWMGTTSHEPFKASPEWDKKNHKQYLKEEDRKLPVNDYLNIVRWSDDKIKDIIEGFRARGLEDSTLFVIHGDHGFPFVGKQKTPVKCSHNEVYKIPFMIYNPRINNPKGQKVTGNFYSMGIPTTILDLLISTNSLPQEAQKSLARSYAERYEYAQSFLRPIKPTLRMFFVNPGGTDWIVDNGQGLRVKFRIDNDYVSIVDTVKDPYENEILESYEGIDALINLGVEEKFGVGTSEFIRAANEKQKAMKTEMPRRYTGRDIV